MKQLYIAEKPSVAKAIAAELGITNKKNGYIECGDISVTWCFGHMLELAEPDEYTPDNIPRNPNGNKVWRTDELPIIPDNWLLHPKQDAEAQLKQIGILIKQADEIVNAGDPDREGQLLIDEVLEHFNNSAPVKRYWTNAIDSVSVKRAIADLKNNNEYLPLGHAAIARQRADWLIGMNLSRAFTLRAERGGSRALISVGRVQTPVLNMVVKRDRDIEKFKPKAYFTLKANLSSGSDEIVANWIANEEQPGLDEEGRLIDVNIASELELRLSGKDAKVTTYEQKPKKKFHPLTFSLSQLTLTVSKKFGYTAEEVLKTCQSLYETHKLTTYPRTDCGYIPESQHSDAQDTLDTLKKINPELSELIDGADTSIKSKTWNDKKVTAHHGIIPTLHYCDKSALNPKEKSIYELIVKTYLAQFYPVHEYMNTQVEFDIDGETFKAKGNVTEVNGWKDVYQETDNESKDDDKQEQPLPALNSGDSLTCKQVIKKDSKTKPPASFTEGTLINAMVNIHKFVDEPEDKKMLREEDGLGTEATRATIISELKNKSFLETKGKTIVSTVLGRSVVDALPEMVKSPILTALYERMLKGIEDGSASLDAFIGKQEQLIKAQVQKANSGSVVIAGAKKALPVSDKHKCKSCDAGLIRRPGKKRGSYWWGCSNYPTCEERYLDFKGKPKYG